MLIKNWYTRMHMASPFLLILCIFSLLSSIFFPSKSHSITSFNGGFAISLIHRDSPQSPFYNHSMTSYDRCLVAAHRSISRLKRLQLRAASKHGLTNISSELFPDELEYILSYYIGTPPIKVYAFVDSGSDAIWTKGIPYFDPSKSFSYTNLSCLNVSCRYLGPERRTCLNNQPCTYEFIYADYSKTSGVLASDKFTFEAPDKSLVDVGFLDFGYSFVSSPHFKGHEDGCLGLNQEQLSLIKQLGINKFSHCMVIPDDQGTASRMYFGSRAVISGDLTPLLKGKEWHYYITLEGISVGDEKVPIPPGVFNVTGIDDGGVIIDSGTSHTMLRKEAYKPFVAMMHEKVQHLPIIRAPGFYELCFEGTYEDLQSIPFVTFHFTGANMRLMKETTFLQLEETVWCLAILENDDTLSLIGNIQMRNLWVGYDLERQVISFAYADCATK